ncbi:MAG TPA: alpha/beta hydrolase family protein [Acidimicrobiales bacterium]
MSADDGGPLLVPPVRNYSPWYQWMARLAATDHEDPLPEGDPDPAAIPVWVERCRARLPELMGQEPSRVPLNVETLESTTCDGYRRDKIVFDTEDTMSVPAYLLVPDARTSAPPGAAVLACHGHGPGKSQVVGLEHTDMPNADYALRLARRGYVVLAPDLRCFGERLDWNPEDHYACDTNLVHAAMAGWNPLTQNIWDLRRSLDVLAEHPLVDPSRLGMVGISYGGTVTLFTAAVDERVAAAVVSGYFSSWAESHKMPWNMCGSQILFGMLGRLEHEDLGSLVAPRPLLIESGIEDLLFPVATATESVRRTRLVYEADEASDRLVHDVFEGGHQWHGTEALPFLDRWLAHEPLPDAG